MKDKNGLALAIGDKIRCNLGECRITQYIGEGTERNGATVKVMDSMGKTYTIALLLSGAEYLPPIRQNESITHSKYGV